MGIMFIDASRLIAENGSRARGGIAAADVDGDGEIEVIVAGTGSANHVLKWIDGTLRDIATGVLVDPRGEATGLIAADIDGDGREEILVVNGGGGPGERRDRLFACFGATWIDLFTQPGFEAGTDGGPSSVAVALDRFGDGRYGLLIAGEDGAPPRLLELTREGRLIDTAEDAGLDLPVAARGATALPLVSEHMDVVLAADGGPNLLFRNLGDGSFEEVAAERGMADPRPAWRAVAPIDAGPQGRGLLVAAWEGPKRLFVPGTAGGVLVDTAGPELSVPERVGTVLVADFDNDGHDEIFINVQGGPNRLFARHEDHWTEIDIGDAAEPKGFGTGAAAVDVDGDGRLELLLTHGGSQPRPMRLFRPTPNDHHWLRVAPLTTSGAPARGALVRLFADGRERSRIVCPGSGRNCQMEPVAHFGLGEVDHVDRVEVSWPGGAVAVIENPPIRRVLTVPHPPI